MQQLLAAARTPEGTDESRKVIRPGMAERSNNRRSGRLAALALPPVDARILGRSAHGRRSDLPNSRRIVQRLQTDGSLSHLLRARCLMVSPKAASEPAAPARARTCPAAAADTAAPEWRRTAPRSGGSVRICGCALTSRLLFLAFGLDDGGQQAGATTGSWRTGKLTDLTMKHLDVPVHGA